MLIPDHLPVELAWLNARHGAPRFGPFAAAPPPDEELDAWAMLLPVAVLIAGRPVGRSALVVSPPAPAGLAACLAADANRVAIAGPAPPPRLQAWCQGHGVAVPWLGPADGNTLESAFQLVFHLDPTQGPPDTARVLQLADAVQAGGELVLAFATGPGTPFTVPPGLSVVRGDTAALPGHPNCSRPAWDRASSACWRPQAPVAVIALRRDR